MRTTLLRTALAAGLAFALAGVGAQAADFNMKCGVLSFNDAEHGYIQMLKEGIEKVSNGKIEVKLFPRGQLGSPAAMVQGLQLGTIECFVMPVDFFAGIDARAGVFSTPFMFKDRAHSNRVFSDPKLFDTVNNLLVDKGVVGVMLAGQADGRYIAKVPLRKLSDFKGKKMRVNATDAERERMKRLGASAIPMGLQDMITALHNGTIDGTMSGQTIHTNFKLYTYSKTLLKTEDTLLVTYAGISKKWLDSMPPDLRKTVLDTIRGMKAKAVELAAEEDRTLSQKWRERGGTFFTWPKEDMDEFRKRVGSVGEDITAKNPAVNAYYKKVKAVSDKY